MIRPFDWKPSRGFRASRSVASLLLVAVVSAGFPGAMASGAAASKRAKDGPCLKAERNKVAVDATSGEQIRCTKVGTKYRWRLVGAAPAGSAAEESITVNKTVYVSGTRIDVQTVRLSSTQIRVEARVTNQNVTDKSVEDHLFRTPVLLEDAAGNRRELAISDVRPIPVGSFMPMTWTADQRDPQVTRSAPRLVFGSGENNQSFVPLLAGPAQTFVPKVGFGVGASIESPEVSSQILDSKLRTTYRGELKGQYSVYIRVKVTGKVKTSADQYVGMDMYTLTLPSGNKVRAAYDGYNDGEILNGAINADKPHTGWLMFVVSEVSGPMTLEYRDSEDAGAVSFTVP
jgi:hypothetical protein